MTAWVMRAIALGALTVALRTALGFAMTYWPTHGVWFRLLCLVVLIGSAFAWGAADGRRDRRIHPDPEHGSDLTILWLQAAVAGGLGSGLLAWVLDFLPAFALGDSGLLFEATAAAAFIVLLIFIPALIGVAVGRRLVDRHHGRAGHDASGQPAGSAA
ncbi:B-4DMT family transporter [Nocardia paucivorans]|uniref:B-4DMT family transporter n=1 Tax=Nocardia paucivorans TaxID=114259 RepID=UPI001FE1ACC6|nr:B-4DMT family transporter [Nocardia paucivorans]